MLLTFHKCISFAKLHKELLEMGNQGAFKFTFGICGIFGNTEKFCHYRRLYILFGGDSYIIVPGQLLHFISDSLLVRRCQQAMIVLRPYVSFQSLDRPHLLCCFVNIPQPCCLIFLTENCLNMRPCKILQTRLQNLSIGEIDVELTVISQCSRTISFAKVKCEPSRKFFQ